MYYNCLSGIDLGDAMYALAQLLAVKIPLFRCACVLSAGQDFATAQAACRAQVPLSLRGAYEAAVALAAADPDNSMGSSSQQLCDWYGGSVENSSLAIFDRWFAHSELAANTLGSFLQDVLVPSGGTQQCLAGVTGDPYAVTLMPTPYDHFYVCGGTSACRLRCAVELATFQVCNSYSKSYTTCASDGHNRSPWLPRSASFA